LENIKINLFIGYKKMAYINLSNIYLDYPIYSDVSKSLKNAVLDKITGGNIINIKGAYYVESLKDITLKIRDGDRIGVMGPNGSGKTSLLRLLGGILSPSKGSMVLRGSVNSFIDIHYGMNLEATGIENIKMRSILLGAKVKNLDSIVESIKEFSELGKYLYMPVKTFSSGMIMRLSFSIMTSINTDIIIMDEWLSVGDQYFKEKADARMQEMIKTSSILIFASHDESLIEKWCNKKIKLLHGSLVSE